MKIRCRFLLLALLLAPAAAATSTVDVNDVAEGYVRLVLEVGFYDEDYVDAYFGPAAWQPAEDQAEEPFPASRLRGRADTLLEQLQEIDRDRFTGIHQQRYDYLYKQLRSVRGKIDLLAGVKMSFDEESRILYDAVAPPWNEGHYQDILAELDRLLPGSGDLYQRFNRYKVKFTVPRLQVEEALERAIAVYRQQTGENVALPAGEGFATEFVFGKPWAAALTYQGQGRSLVEINFSAPFGVADILRLARHELYPGHHTHLTLLDTQLVQQRRWLEFSVLPLYSPLALIAEGLAEYASYDLFTPAERLEFEGPLLSTLLEIDPAEGETYDRIMKLKSALDGAIVEAARRYLDGQLDDEPMRQWLRRYALVAPGAEGGLIDFVDKHGSYVINYTVGRQLVQDYITRHGGATDPARRWRLFQTLLSTPQTPSTLVAAQGEAGAVPKAVQSMIEQAGNADDDQQRLSVLKELSQQQNLANGLRADVDRLRREIERWLTEPRLDYFGRTISRELDWDFGIDPNSPLYPLTLLYRGRMLVWYTLESGGVWNNASRRDMFLGPARRHFAEYSRHFPQNRIARMYLGEPIGPEKHYRAIPGAPDWAIYQREGLERLADIVEWWIDNRMRDNGEYGGGWGDDCEMWRWWVPVLIGFDDPKMAAAQQRFSEALMQQEHMRQGYTTHMTDVEHTAEDSADVITPMMHLDPENPVWLARAKRLAQLMEDRWTGRNERGGLQFKSTYFTVDRVDDRPQRACDTVYHPRAVQPALLYWQRTGDPHLTELFTAWMDTWVEAAARAERGKPAGIIPSAIHWPDGRVGGLADDWWDPRNHGEHTLYLWPSAMSMMMNTMLLTHHMTGRDKYLEPIRSMARARLRYLQNPPSQSPPAGSEAWCAARMGFVSSIVAKYHFLTGRNEFDELLRRDTPPYTGFRLTGDRRQLATALRDNALALRLNWPGYTSEVRYTDRVLRFPQLFRGGLITDQRVEAIGSPNPPVLYATATGDPGDALYFPMNAVRWLTPPRDIAVLVTDSGKTSFTAEFFHFGTDARPMAAELYLLEQGRYTLTLVAGNEEPLSQTVAVAGPHTRVQFTLPPRTLCTLRIR